MQACLKQLCGSSATQDPEAVAKLIAEKVTAMNMSSDSVPKDSGEGLALPVLAAKQKVVLPDMLADAKRHKASLTYWLAPTNNEATTFCLSKEDIYRLCLDRPVIAGRRQPQAADKKCLIFELLSTRPDNCTSWPTYRCASQKLAQLLKCSYSPKSSNRTHSLPYTKTAVYCPQPQGQHQAFCSFVALRYLEISLVPLCFQNAD